MENINNDDTQDNNPDQTTEGELHDSSEDVLDDEPSAQPESEFSTFTSESNPPPLPPFAGAQVEDRLVRDPHTFLGGVLSGIANRYGWDTSLTRLAFVVALFLSGGAAIPAYLMAWVIIPRARFWPPVVRKRSRSLSGRDLGLALIGVALLVTIGVGAGEAAAIIVPVALVIGGVWMLVQKPREELAVAGFNAPAAPLNFEFSSGTGQPAGPTGTPWTSAQMPTITPEPVAPRSRGRKFVVAGLIAAGLLLPVLIIGGGIAALAFSDIDIEVSETVTPDSIEAIPAELGTGDGEYILDLTNVDFSDVDTSDPVELTIDQQFGRIEVLLEDDVAVAVEADANLGELQVFGEAEDGINPNVSITDDDAQLVLDLSVELGEIVVARG